MQKCVAMECAECAEVLPGSRKADVFVGTTPDVTCVRIVLTVVVPKAYRANIVITAFIKRPVAAARAADL
jgi:hypothetical protein